MPSTLAIMVTMTTYGTWLRGDHRGWVDDGEILPHKPLLEAADRERMKHPPFLFDNRRLLEVGQMIGTSLSGRKQVTILALTVGAWHCHFVVAATAHPIGNVVKCAKDAARYGLRPDRPIWTANYDKRFCFDKPSVRNRVRYVERHNEREGWPPRPWSFIADLEEYLASVG